MSNCRRLLFNAALQGIRHYTVILSGCFVVHVPYMLYTERYNESTESIDVLPLVRLELTTIATPPSTTPDIDATDYATEICCSLCYSVHLGLKLQCLLRVKEDLS